MTDSRLRYNNQAGSLGADLNNSETDITFAVAPDFLTLANGDFIVLALDSGLSSYEIVYLTAYTQGSTLGTIQRAAEDSGNWPAVAHVVAAGPPQTGTWACVPTVDDFTEGIGVSQLIAGSGVTLSPPDGLGDVTVTAVGDVSSFNTRTGAITLVKGDVTATGLTYSDVDATQAGTAVPESLLTTAATPNGVPQLTGAGLVAVDQIPANAVVLLDPSIGAPSSGLGENNDYAIDLTTGSVYGPKASGAWPGSPAYVIGGIGTPQAVLLPASVPFTATSSPVTTTLVSSPSLSAGTYLVAASGDTQFNTGTAPCQAIVDVGITLGTPANGTIIGPAGWSQNFELQSGVTSVFPVYPGACSCYVTLTGTSTINLVFRVIQGSLANPAGGNILGAANQSASPVTITGATFSGTTVTYTNSGTNGFSTGNLISVAGVTGFTTNNPNYSNLVVLASGLTSTTFEAVVPSAPTGTYGSGGTARTSLGSATGLTYVSI